MQIAAIIAWISYLLAHATAIGGIITAIVMFAQAVSEKDSTKMNIAWAALLAALGAWSNPRRPDPSMKLG